MIAAAAAALALQAAAPGPVPAPAPPGPPDTQQLVDQFLYFRAMAFHDMAAARCPAGQPDFVAIEARLDAARRQLVERIGAARIERLAPPSEVPPGECRMTLFGYANAVAELQHHLGPPAQGEP